jgi:hypothetical protein
VRQLRPVVWLPLGLPIGISSGFITAAMANDLARAGVSESAISDVVATFFLAT